MSCQQLIGRMVFPFIMALTLICNGNGQYSRMSADQFDTISDQMITINAENCQSRPKYELFLPDDTVSQIPVYNKLQSKTLYPNRTSLVHLHNMALNRAFFYSFILQKLNASKDFEKQPSWSYYYFSSVADLNANPNLINGSASYFDKNCHYPNWLTDVYFNGTLPLFGPKAYRWNQNGSQVGSSSGNIVEVKDIGTGEGKNYTQSSYKVNPWYSMWMPDLHGYLDSVTKSGYQVNIKYSNATGQFKTDDFQTYRFFGPSSQTDPYQNKRMLPVQFTKPYFDCGGSNKWVVSAVSPIIDFLPRYTRYTHLKRPRVVASVVMDIDFLDIDINPCPLSEGNPPPNALAGIAHCLNTTQCNPKSGFGFQRGSYTCECKPGYNNHWWALQPYQGDEIERAIGKEFEEGFGCSIIDDNKVKPNGNTSDVGGVKSNKQTNLTTTVPNEVSTVEEYVKSNNVSYNIEEMYKEDVAAHQRLRRNVFQYVQESNYTEATSLLMEDAKEIRTRHLKRYTKSKTDREQSSSLFDEKQIQRMMHLLRKKSNVTAENCHGALDEELQLPHDIGYGVAEQFSVEGRTALRLSHFFSAYFQNVKNKQMIDAVIGGQQLNQDDVFGEVIANVMGNDKIYSAGVYFVRDKFKDTGIKKELFGPWAYKKDGISYVIDTAGLSRPYTQDTWFQNASETFSNNLTRLKLYKMRSFIRSNSKGSKSVKTPDFPLSYRAATYESGIWSDPYYRCDGIIDAWVMKYQSPFYGPTPSGAGVEFWGVTTVEVPLDLLQINQCPQPHHIQNAFKNTAKCDYLTTTCEHQPGIPFRQGSYRCRCRLGFEDDNLEYKSGYDGLLLEDEFGKLKSGNSNRFDLLKCHISDVDTKNNNDDTNNDSNGDNDNDDNDENDNDDNDNGNSKRHTMSKSLITGVTCLVILYSVLI